MILEHAGDQDERTLKNIAHPVRVYRVSWEATVAEPASLAQEKRELPGPPPALPQLASIAVLPFATSNSDGERAPRRRQPLRQERRRLMEITPVRRLLRLTPGRGRT
jgi:hypothetical protein